MGYEDKTGLNVSNHYGPRDLGGANGVHKMDGGLNQLVIDFNEDQPLHDDVYIPSGAIIREYSVIGVPGAVTVTVGGTDVTGVQIDDRLTWLVVDTDTAGGLVEWTYGSDEGRVIIEYIHTVDTTASALS